YALPRNVGAQQLVAKEDSQRASALDRNHRRHQLDAFLRAFGFERRASLHLVAGDLLTLAESRNPSRPSASAEGQISAWRFDFDHLRILELVRPADRSRRCGRDGQRARQKTSAAYGDVANAFDHDLSRRLCADIEVLRQLQTRS